MSHPIAPWSRPAPPSSPASPPASDAGVERGGLGRVALAGAPVPAGVVDGERTRTFFYHRLSHTDRNHRWWMPLVEGLISGTVLLLLTIAFFLAAFLVLPLDPTGDIMAMDQLDPSVFFLLFGSVTLMLPSALLARLVLGPRPLGLIFSVTGRIRWTWLFTCVLVAVAVYALVNLVGTGLDLAAGASPTPVRLAPGFWWLLATTLLVVPVQCAAEEVVFRGYLAQMVGRWLKHPAWAILLPVPLFMAGHMYDIWGQLAVGIMAVSMGLVTWRTGGLEAGIALHAVNNMSISLLAAVGLVDMNETSGSPGDLVVELILNGLYVALVFWLVRRRPDVAVTRTVVLPPPPAPPRLPAARPAETAADRSGIAAYPYDPGTQTYLTLPPEHGPYTVVDGRGRFVGILDTRQSLPQQPAYTEPHDAQH